MDVNKTRSHDPLTAPPGGHSRRDEHPRRGENHGEPGFRQLPVADGTGWIGIADITGVCGALLRAPAA